MSLLIGLGFLAACTAAGRLVEAYGHGAVPPFVGEGLLIGGWVAMWRPLEISLYGWWPLARRRRVAARLARMEVEFRAAGRTAPGAASA